ncbi:MAG: heme biosynthesis HemY N-terminal domain-containing protein [Propionivibrio sp.]
MRGLLWVLALFALAVGISLAMHVNDGYVLLVMPPYRAEISLNLAILLVLLAFAVLYAFLRAAALTLSLPRRVRAFRERRERERSLAAFGEGVRLYLSGSLRESLDKAAEVRGDGQWPALAAMLAAEAARQLGDEGQREIWQARLAALDERRTPETKELPRPGVSPTE